MSNGADARRWEVLSAYVDGELDDSAMAEVDRSLRTDREMAADLAALRRQDDALRDWAETVVDRPVPPAVRALLRKARAEATGVSAPEVPYLATRTMRCDGLTWAHA